MSRFGLVAAAILALTAGTGRAQTAAPLPPTISALQVQAPSPSQSQASPLLSTGPVLVTMADGTQVPVFGSDLFSGAFASARPGARSDYPIQPGDQIAVRLFGAVNSDAVQ